MPRQSIVIWGAGKIGRGVVGDLFNDAGYRLCLVRRSEDLVTKLREAGQYTVVRTLADDSRETVVIKGYTALATTQREELASEIVGADLLAIAVFAGHLEEVARQLVPHLLERRRLRARAPLDILVIANLLDAGPEFRILLENALPKEAHQYMASKIGVVETFAMSAAVDPPDALREKDPLQVWTSGYPKLHAERRAFRGPILELPTVKLLDDMHAEGARKLFLDNMLHTLIAYHGFLRGYDMLADALADPQVRVEAEGAVAEADQALRAEFGFPHEEMERMVTELLTTAFSNPSLGDTVKRVGRDPIRKLGRSERLLGPTLLARKHGNQPLHLIAAAAAGFRFDPGGDQEATDIQERIEEVGLAATVAEVCGLTDDEQDIVDAIIDAYQGLATSDQSS
jgi:mannitol-1-phosphate 5-dehydrogenase